jgi:aspartyl-tRNA(Asn)/glutamyl-tRNA(Gln) amidotransferase subunit A
VDAEGARAAARAADEERMRGRDRGPLHGIPISIKDLIDIAGQPTTAASRVRQGKIAAHDATVITRLREAGAVLLGKTNLHEFALGTTSEESAWGAVHHPRDASRSAGGSSGGSAAAVATGMGLASIGSDTGGSIRIPAAACGVVGLKPSFGEVPLDGVIPLSVSLDHVGPLARSVQDAAWLWAVLAGQPHHDFGRPPEPASIRLCRLTGYFSHLADDVRAPFERALSDLRRGGVVLIDGEIPHCETIMPAYVNLALPEAAHYHAIYRERQAADYAPNVRARLEQGAAVPAIDYLSARETQDTLRRAVDARLDDCDALVLPTLPIVAPPIGAADVPIDSGDRLPVRSAMLRQTQLFNLTGHPAISLPIRTSGWPVGFQLVGKAGQTARLLAIAQVIEPVVCLES